MTESWARSASCSRMQPWEIAAPVVPMRESSYESIGPWMPMMASPEFSQSVMESEWSDVHEDERAVTGSGGRVLHRHEVVAGRRGVVGRTDAGREVEDLGAAVEHVEVHRGQVDHHVVRGAGQRDVALAHPDRRAVRALGQADVEPAGLGGDHGQNRGVAVPGARHGHARGGRIGCRVAGDGAVRRGDQRAGRRGGDARRRGGRSGGRRRGRRGRGAPVEARRRAGWSPG